MIPFRRRSLAVVALVGTAATAALAGAAAPAVAGSGSATATTVVSGKVPGADPCCGQAFLRPGQQLRSNVPPESALSSGGLDAPGSDGTFTTTSPYHLVLQSDGNLVEYRRHGTSGVAVWSANTHSSSPVTLLFQRDGNVVLYDTSHHALWSTGTAGRPAAYFDVYGNGQVVTQDAGGRVLSAVGPAVVPLPGIAVEESVSPAFVRSAAYRYLAVQSDGNLVEYQTSGPDPGPARAVWASGTAGAGAVRLAAQGDSNLVLYQLSTGRAVWNSRSHGPSAYYQLDVQDDGNLVLYRTDGVRRVQAVWATGIRH